MTELTNQQLNNTMAVLNDSQVSNHFDGRYNGKYIYLSALSPRVIHNIIFSIFLSIYILLTGDRRQTKQFCFLDADCLLVGESQSSSRR